jgi:NADPH-dependent 2,4-dienoyl-CoA reductase/sulfur reductase-like enzyme
MEPILISSMNRIVVLCDVSAADECHRPGEAYVMNTISTRKTITEPARDIEVCREVEVLVVGGGPGGIGSALAAARSGADTVLVERYGHLGGMATGGLVTIIPNLSNINGEQQIAGICQELVDRLDARGATDYPKKEDWGSTDETLVKRYRFESRLVLHSRGF